MNLPHFYIGSQYNDIQISNNMSAMLEEKRNLAVVERLVFLGFCTKWCLSNLVLKNVCQKKDFSKV